MRDCVYVCARECVYLSERSLFVCIIFSFFLHLIHWIDFWDTFSPTVVTSLNCFSLSLSLPNLNSFQV